MKIELEPGEVVVEEAGVEGEHEQKEYQLSLQQPQTTTVVMTLGLSSPSSLPVVSPEVEEAEQNAKTLGRLQVLVLLLH